MDSVTNKRRRVLFSIIALVAVCFWLEACVVHVHAHEDRDYGPTKTEQRDLSGFTGVDAGGVFDITITPATEYSVSIEAGEQLLPLIETKVSKDTLKIKFDRSVNNVNDVKVMIGMPELNHVDMSGASSLQVEQGFESERFSVDLSGAASSSIDIAVNKLLVDLSGAADLELAGKAYTLQLDASGAAEISAEDMVVRDAQVDLSGASEIDLNVTGELVVDASGASDVNCIGRPQSTRVDTSGMSDISC